MTRPKPIRFFQDEFPQDRFDWLYNFLRAEFGRPDFYSLLAVILAVAVNTEAEAISDDDLTAEANRITDLLYGWGIAAPTMGELNSVRDRAFEILPPSAPAQFVDEIIMAPTITIDSWGRSLLELDTQGYLYIVWQDGAKKIILMPNGFDSLDALRDWRKK